MTLTTQQAFKATLRPEDLPLEFYHGDFLYSKWFDGLFHVHPKDTPRPVDPFYTRPVSLSSIPQAIELLLSDRNPVIVELARKRGFEI